MQTQTRQALEKIVRFSAPVIGAVIGLAVAECTGLSGYLQEFEQAKSAVTSGFFGNFMGNMQYYGSYVARAAIDASITALGALAGMSAAEKFENRSRRNY